MKLEESKDSIRNLESLLFTINLNDWKSLSICTFFIKNIDNEHKNPDILYLDIENKKINVFKYSKRPII